MLSNNPYELIQAHEIRQSKKMTNTMLMDWIKSTQQIGGNELSVFFKHLENTIDELNNVFR